MDVARQLRITVGYDMTDFKKVHYVTGPESQSQLGKLTRPAMETSDFNLKTSSFYL